ncbi:MAG: 2OG-Fe(II) oxygenase, partial [Gemmatimonadales bacterium]
MTGVGATVPVADRVAALDWPRMGAELDAHGSAVARSVLDPEECERLAALYPAEGPFRSRIVMGRHGFGRGEYKYFAYPLPELVGDLRAALYPPLAGIANRWNEALG